MTFIALLHDPVITLATDQLVLRADEVQPVRDAVQLAERVTQHLEETEEQLNLARQRAHDEGYAAGKAAGLQAGREEIAGELTTLMAAAYQQRLALQGSVARLAIQVVRKVAGEIGATEIVAGLAQTAAGELASGTSLRLWVHPTVVESVRARLNSATEANALHVEIRADETLDPFDCTLSTDCGETVAGLDDQLKRLEMVLSKELASEVYR